MFRALVAAVALIASSGSAGAHTGYETGTTLLAHCGLPGLEICLGYVAGIADAMDGGHDVIGGWRSCIPNGTPNSEIMNVVIHELQKHPETRHYLASGLVAYALNQAFPCAE